MCSTCKIGQALLLLQAFKQHPNRPDALRCEQLAEPWQEGALSKALELRPREAGVLEFETACAMAPPALFNRDASFERSVFLPGAPFAFLTLSRFDTQIMCMLCETDIRAALGCEVRAGDVVHLAFAGAVQQRRTCGALRSRARCGFQLTQLFGVTVQCVLHESSLGWHAAGAAECEKSCSTTALSVFMKVTVFESNVLLQGMFEVNSAVWCLMLVCLPDSAQISACL